MALFAGVDIGNSTTEIVIAEGITPIAWERLPTRGCKGSEASVRSAAALLRNIERKAGVEVSQVIVAPWHPITTEVTRFHKPPPDTGKIQVIGCANHSVVGNSWATGKPWNISKTPARAIPVVAIVESETGYKQASERINQAIEQGITVSGVIAADDEAVLIASRLSTALPVVDRADCQTALGAEKLFIEVRPAGQCVNTATDVWALKNALEAQGQEAESLNLVSRWVGDLRAVVIGLFEESVNRSPAPATPSVTFCTGESVDLADAMPLLRSRFVGSVCALNLEETIRTRDVWGVDIDGVLADRGVRAYGQSGRMALASLSNPVSEPRDSLSTVFEVPVTVANSESEAASIGARTTPGLSREAIILDIGGGTIDLVGNDGSVTAAGAGELLSAAVAAVLDVPKGAADWIKRGPAQRLDSAQVLLSENGSYDFVPAKDAPRLANSPGMLVTPGPTGPLSFGRNMQPAEWRIIRQSLKLEIIGRNVSRILQTYTDKLASDETFDIVIVGGPAEDDELLPALGRLAEVRGLGRGNVAGSLGHRFAVAYGLTQSSVPG
ncbi:MAG: diol dehydratase reactivase ATPase-like domain-containing protein [Gammaproteobacteria bacterium]|jgi:hypothetical protein